MKQFVETFKINQYINKENVLCFRRQLETARGIMFSGMPSDRPLTLISSDAVSPYLVDGLQWNFNWHKIMGCKVNYETETE